MLQTAPERWRLLKAHGPAVGLPTEDDMGNSEVGHNALGAGRIFKQGWVRRRNPQVQESLNVLFFLLIVCLFVSWTLGLEFFHSILQQIYTQHERERERENVDLRWFWW